MSRSFSSRLESLTLGGPQKTAPPSGAFIKGETELWRLQFSLPPDLVFFQGHFEGAPLLPAMAQVILAKYAARRIVAGPLSIAAITQAKFLSPVAPHHLLSVYALGPVSGSGDWRFHLTSRAGDKGDEIDASYLKMKMEAAIGE